MAAAAAGKTHHGNEIKTQFCTKEGKYRVLRLSDYSRPMNNTPNNIPVKLSFVTLKGGGDSDGDNEDKIAFNIGRDMFFYNFRGVKKAPDLNHPIDRRTYKGPIPTCHDINLMTRTPQSIDLLIGFTAGQIQLMDPIQHECRKCFNDERLIEKGAVTCVKWLPGSESKFLVSYNNPNIYIYDKNLPSLITEPQLAVSKRGNGYTVEVCKNKQDYNPLCRWKVGHGGVNELAFSPDCKHLAIASQDGYLRIFDFEKQELISSMRSYFGGILCVCWSPDGKYVVTGGEDDLVTIWSFYEQRVVARGEGHRSWVNVVSFDAYTTQINDRFSLDNSEDEETNESSNASLNHSQSRNKDVLSYRIGSVGDDTQLLLWDIDEEILKPQRVRTRSARVPTSVSSSSVNVQPSWTFSSNTMKPSSRYDKNDEMPSSGKFHTLNRLTSKNQNSVSSYTPPHVEMDDLLLGSKICPRMTETSKLEPLVAKKIAYDRISSLVFREDCIVTSTYEGYINVWARPDDPGVTDGGGGGTLIQ
ncbi:WD repeat-containing protein 20-like [Clytia hemisphaerica]|uniref:Uncharacterized protein n=1 Tax=Clytia hemisphaerica TaxID=252671 RepID=A0A7M5XE07_9CNID|eukprot:TCONS_00018926-protein